MNSHTGSDGEAQPREDLGSAKAPAKRKRKPAYDPRKPDSRVMYKGNLQVLQDGNVFDRVTRQFIAKA